MAQVDTGLGWSADSDSLLSTPINLISGRYYTPKGYTVPYVTDQSGSSTTGMRHIMDYYWSESRLQHVYTCVIEGDDDVYWFWWNFPNNQLSGNANFTGRISWYSKSPFKVVEVVIWNEDYRRYVYTGTYDSGYGTYSVSDYFAVRSTYQALENPVYSERTDGLADVTPILTFAKTNSGYSTNAFILFNDGTKAVVGLSSVEANAEISVTGSYGGHAISTSSNIDGVTFYLKGYTTSADISSAPITTGLYLGDDTGVSLLNFVANLTGVHVNGAPEPGDDPYSGNSISETGGGGGIGYDNIINDDVDFPSLPLASAANANFISIWTPTLEQLQALASWMWTTDPVKWEFWQKLLQNPLELIYSLSIMPIPIHHTDDITPATEEELIAANSELTLGWQNTGLYLDWIEDQFVTLDMGSIDLEEVWKAFLDYEPYTKIDIFLPYIGTKQLDTNDCMPRTIALRYVIDLATGTCVALIKCDDSVYYHFSGNCASQIPITVNQCQEIIRGLMTMAVGAATFSLGAAYASGAHASQKAITKGLAMAAGGAAVGRSGVENAAKGVTVSRSGTIGCAAGLMDIQTPYLIISRPRQAIPDKQNKYTGYPSFITEQIGDLTGYTEVQIIHLENMTCTDEEYEEINALLVEGVII